MTSGQADINGKIVRGDTGEILAVVPNAHGKKPHISPSTAGVNAMNEAAGKLGKNHSAAYRKVEHGSVELCQVLCGTKKCRFYVVYDV